VLRLPVVITVATLDHLGPAAPGRPVPDRNDTRLSSAGFTDGHEQLLQILDVDADPRSVDALGGKVALRDPLAQGRIRDAGDPARGLEVDRLSEGARLVGATSGAVGSGVNRRDGQRHQWQRVLRG
jgi:hypothetical protein